MNTFHLAIICGHDDFLKEFLSKFSADSEFMEDCVLSTLEINFRQEDLGGKLFLVSPFNFVQKCSGQMI